MERFLKPEDEREVSIQGNGVLQMCQWVPQLGSFSALLLKGYSHTVDQVTADDTLLFSSILLVISSQSLQIDWQVSSINNLCISGPRV